MSRKKLLKQFRDTVETVYFDQMVEEETPEFIWVKGCNLSKSHRRKSIQ